MKNFLSDIKIESTQLTNKTDEELREVIEKIKKKSEKETVDKVIKEWFALVQEVSNRKIGLKHFDTQLLGGLFLHQGNIVEMKTGEGKTLASTLAISLNALTKKGVHVVTVNDYLAERDQKWMGKIYSGLGLTSGLVKSNSNKDEKRKSYKSDITYVTNSELVFDYLRDCSAYYKNEIVQPTFNYCIIDEIDSILIDEARTPLILSEPGDSLNIPKLWIAKNVIKSLEKENDFEIDEKRRDIFLTEKGDKKVRELLRIKNLYDKKSPWILEILNALKAQYLFKLNKDYIVLNNKIVIIDEFTGRIMSDRRWSLGIHEAIEIKENVEVKEGTKTKSSITYQNFFTLYPKLAGMTGTAKTAEKEFQEIYNLNVVVLETHKPLKREDKSDFVYQMELSKWKAVLELTQDCFKKGQPILIGTTNIEKSEFLSNLFEVSKLPHQLLNAKPENVTRESEIIAQAGKKHAITISTTMAGRGTDIILGGNPMFKVKEKISDLLLKNKNYLNDEKGNKLIELIKKEYENSEVNNLELDITNLPYSLETSLKSLQNLYNYFYEDIFEIWQKENKEIKELGGLFVLGTERHETRRIDNQLRGRAGRQGDPGISQFYLSLEDELLKIFGGDSIKKWLEYLADDIDSPLQSDLLTKSLETAQEKVEDYNFGLRKNVFKYDEMLNTQRKKFSEGRSELLTKSIINQSVLRSFESILDDEIKRQKTEKNTFEFYCETEYLVGAYSLYSKIEKNQKKINHYKEVWITMDLLSSHGNFYQVNLFVNLHTLLFLNLIDFYWTEHLEIMSFIRETINWRSYGQENPLVEYNLKAIESFKAIVEEFRLCMLYLYLSINNFFNTLTLT
jgi:preprotein translocase subunit SecA